MKAGEKSHFGKKRLRPTISSGGAVEIQQQNSRSMLVGCEALGNFAKPMPEER
jgi:hypothetical protein